MFLFKKHYAQPAVAALILDMFIGSYSFQLFCHSFVNSQFPCLIFTQIMTLQQTHIHTELMNLQKG